MMEELKSDFEQEIGSLGAIVLNTKEVSSGAKIRHIFHDRLQTKSPFRH